MTLPQLPQLLYLCSHAYCQTRRLLLTLALTLTLTLTLTTLTKCKSNPNPNPSPNVYPESECSQVQFPGTFVLVNRTYLTLTLLS